MSDRQFAWAPVTATGIGSLPGTSSAEAARVVAGELPDFIHVFELPARGPGSDIIGRTATLQFRLVETDSAAAAETVPQRLSVGETVPRTVGLKRDVIATGEQLKQASAGIDKDQRPMVSVRLDDVAGR
ncbi:MAG: hypothetical protein NTV96_04070, partial [Actinobacteria bacterium]|nr:hypothetical protein [Actinomycetota bacterium]